MDITYITYNTLRSLFNTSPYVRVIEPPKIQSNPPKKQRIEHNFSPYTQALISHFSPDTKKKLAVDLKLDNDAIDDLVEKQDKDDPDYKQFDPTGNGVYLESWFCANIKCPICGAILYKYANPNMPAVDVICTAHEPSEGVKYFQIKATTGESIFFNRKPLKYFSYDENYVCTGSKRFGYNCHVIKADDYNNRDLLIGYICIEYTMIGDNIKINMNKSFLLLPNINFKHDIHTKDLTFYSYNVNPKKTIINFDPNTNMVRKINFSVFYINEAIWWRPIHLYIAYTYEPINPLDPVKRLTFGTPASPASGASGASAASDASDASRVLGRLGATNRYTAKSGESGASGASGASAASRVLGRLGRLGAKEKYFIMKMKYLNLKNLFEKIT